MIFRKPYKFLIKHFRLIHLILCTLIAYLIYKNKFITTFFNDYINSKKTSYFSNVATKYVEIPMFIAVLIVLALLIFIYLLMKKKDKPRKFYVFSVVFYIVNFFALFIARGIFSTFENNIVNMQVAGVYRDLSLIFTYIQYVIIVVFFFRGIGFNIRKFNFSKDLEEMQIDAKDNEEFEFVLGNNGYKYKRSFRKSLREIGYYIKENKFIFTMFCLCIVSLFALIYYLNHNIYNKVYKENEAFNNSIFSVKVLNSYITDTDYNGQKYNSNYMILNLDITNNSSSNNALNVEDYRIIIDDNTYYPTSKMNDSFVDLGSPYIKDEIGPNKSVQKLVIYKIPKKVKNKNYFLRVINKLNFRESSIMAKYFNVKLNPIILADKVSSNSFNLKDEINFSKTTLGDTKLIVNSYNINGSYIYDSKSCINNKCSNIKNVIYSENMGNYIINLKYSLDLADSSYKNYINNSNEFFDDFMKIRYEIDDKILTRSVKNRTPDNLKDEFVGEIPGDAVNSSNLSLVFKVRNNEYEIKLK